jgi:hypothetical protein
MVVATVYSREASATGLAFIAGLALSWPHVAFLHVRIAPQARWRLAARGLIAYAVGALLSGLVLGFTSSRRSTRWPPGSA